MLSGIGDAAQLRRTGVHRLPHLLGGGQNFMNHILLGGCVWGYDMPEAPRNNLAECAFFGTSDSRLDTPHLRPFQIEIPDVSDTNAGLHTVLQSGWSIAPA